MLISRPPSMVTMGLTSTPGGAHVDEHEGDPLLRLDLGIRAREAEHHVRPLGGGDPGLGSVDDVVVAVADRPRAQAREIGAGVRLRVTLAPPRFVPRDGRQVLRLLRIAAEGVDHRPDHLRPEGDDPRCVGAAHLLLEDVALHGRPARPTVLHRPRIDEPALFGEDVLPAKIVFFSELQEAFDLLAEIYGQPLLDERAYLLLEIVQLVGELQVHRPFLAMIRHRRRIRREASIVRGEVVA